jgi:hypothetical protein
MPKRNITELERERIALMVRFCVFAWTKKKEETNGTDVSCCLVQSSVGMFVSEVDNSERNRLHASSRWIGASVAPKNLLKYVMDIAVGI